MDNFEAVAAIHAALVIRTKKERAKRSEHPEGEAFRRGVISGLLDAREIVNALGRDWIEAERNGLESR